MVEEIKKSRDPIVIINFIERTKGHYITKIDMTISNKGLSSAKDINLKAAYEPPFTQNEIIKGKVKINICQLNELPIFRN